MVVPGLLQTPAYGEAIIQHGSPELSRTEVANRVELRRARQQILQRTDPALRLWSVLDESVLRRAVGGPAVLVEQLGHLIEMSKKSQIKIQILPADVGAHPGIEGSFQILSFPPELLTDDPGVSYVETRTQAIYYEGAEEIAEYRNVLTRLQVQAHTAENSRAIMKQAAQEMTS